MNDLETAVVEAAKKYVAEKEAAQERVNRKGRFNAKQCRIEGDYMLRHYSDLYMAVTDLAKEATP